MPAGGEAGRRPGGGGEAEGGALRQGFQPALGRGGERGAEAGEVAKPGRRGAVRQAEQDGIGP